MKRYGNLSTNSGVRGYETGTDFIVVWFGDWLYVYDYRIPGQTEVEALKALADAGKGLSSFISRRVKGRYAAKYPATTANLRRRRKRRLRTGADLP
jgi:hypothetical protein